jgi:uncharacterized protein YkwD
MNKKRFAVMLLLVLVMGLIYGEEYSSMLIPNDGVKELDFLADIEKEIIIELNKARSNPAAYAAYLEEFKNLYVGKYIYFAGRTPYVTHEGASAVSEAIAVLKVTAPVPVLRVSRGLSAAAKAHIEEQSATGATGHSGADGSTPGERANRFGKWRKEVGENIDYGSADPREIIMLLIIDDGVKNRGHRQNIFKPGYGVVGVSFGPHQRYGNMCTLDFAGAYTENEDD